MPSAPYLPLYTGDWKKDPALSLCSPATRGVWIDLLCSMHDGRIGQVTGTPIQLAQLCRCDAASMLTALKELQANKAANISDRLGVFTVVCRRMVKAIELSNARAMAGGKGGSKTASKVQASPEYDNEGEGEKIIVEYCRELGLPDSDGTACFHKWIGNGWTNGGQPIRDWKATIRSWKAAGYLPSQKPATGTRGGFGAKEDKLHFHEKAKAPIPEPPGFQSWLDSTYPDKAGTKLASMVRPLQESLMKEFNTRK